MVEKTHGHGWWPDLQTPLRQFGERIADWFQPRSEARAQTDAYRVAVELPGVARDNIEIHLHDGVLTVRGEKRRETSEERGGWLFSEREYGRFQRTFRLPADADGDGVTASHADGVLTISIPKRAAAQDGSRRIEVTASS